MLLPRPHNILCALFEHAHYTYARYIEVTLTITLNGLPQLGWWLFFSQESVAVVAVLKLCSQVMVSDYSDTNCRPR